MQTRVRRLPGLPSERFLEKYFLASARHEREAEFLTFQQGNLTVQAYTNRFEYLARFYTPTVTEEWRCRKYEGGLKHELRRFIVPLRIREFPVLVEQTKVVEQLEMGPTKGLDHRRLPRIHGNRRSRMIGHRAQLRNYSATTVVESIIGGIVQNPQAVLVVLVVVALASAMFVIRQAIFHDTARIEN